MENFISNIPHLEKTGKLTELIVDGKPFLIFGGEIHNSSSSNMDYMEPIWNKVVDLNCNAILAPVYWELLEPIEGKFDFALVDGLIEKAREHRLRLIFLWFATWKNGNSTYAPSWVKTNLIRFPRSQTMEGKNTMMISPFAAEACELDARAFSELMKHIREIDGNEHTVLAVQVENESGMLGSERDYSSLAEIQFKANVPDELLKYLSSNAEELLEEVKLPWTNAGKKLNGSWEEVFEDIANETFMAWFIARYIDKIASAGKQEYSLPTFVNAWHVWSDTDKPGQYPSGGPVSRMFDLWRCAAPNIDFIAPDIYLETFADVCASYSRLDNPLFIPEARRDKTAAANLFYAFGQHDALCFAPFGIESLDLEKGPEISGIVHQDILNMKSGDSQNMVAKSYKLLSGMMGIICKYRGTGKMIGVLQDTNGVKEIKLGGYILKVSFPKLDDHNDVPGGGIIIAVSDNEYICIGHNYTVTFHPLPTDPLNVDFLYIEEGIYSEDKWIAGRRLNGDEYGVYLGISPIIIRTALYHFD